MRSNSTWIIDIASLPRQGEKKKREKREKRECEETSKMDFRAPHPLVHPAHAAHPYYYPGTDKHLKVNQSNEYTTIIVRLENLLETRFFWFFQNDKHRSENCIERVRARHWINLSCSRLEISMGIINFSVIIRCLYSIGFHDFRDLPHSDVFIHSRFYVENER